jgi:adenylate cyclase
MSYDPHGTLTPLGGGDPIPLLREKLVLGRRESCDIPLRFPNVSGVHCQLTFREGYWHIRDMGSTNGIKVNQIRVQEKYLHPNDEITIAKRRFKIDYQLMAGQPQVGEIEEEDVMSQPLLEKAGLAQPRPQPPPVDNRPKNFDPGEFLLEDEE